MRGSYKIDEIHAFREIMIMLPAKSEFSWQLDWLDIWPNTVPVFCEIENPFTIVVICMSDHILNWYLVMCPSKRVKMVPLNNSTSRLMKKGQK